MRPSSADASGPHQRPYLGHRFSPPLVSLRVTYFIRVTHPIPRSSKKRNLQSSPHAQILFWRLQFGRSPFRVSSRTVPTRDLHRITETYSSDTILRKTIPNWGVNWGTPDFPELHAEPISSPTRIRTQQLLESGTSHAHISCT